MTDNRNYRDLVVWKQGMDLVEAVYRATQTLPREEVYGLTSQMRRAAVSIPSNIAEGQSRMTPGEFLPFLGIARGSLAEVETQILLAQRLGYMATETVKPLLGLAAEVGRLLNGLIRSLCQAH